MSDLREAIARWLCGSTWEVEFPSTKDRYRSKADSLLAILRAHGLVELDSDQSLPENPVEVPFISGYGYDHTQYNKYAAAQQTVLKAGFKKVKEIA